MKAAGGAANSVKVGKDPEHELRVGSGKSLEASITSGAYHLTWSKSARLAHTRDDACTSAPRAFRTLCPER